MTPQNWERLKPLFERAVALPAAERTAFVGRVLLEDDTLGRDLEELLAAEEEAGAFDQPMIDFHRPLDLKALASAVAPQDRNAGERTTGADWVLPVRVIARRFRVIRHVGNGGMGDVYEAEDLQLRERVALKTIRADIVASPLAVARFKREVVMGKKVAHPNVCRIHDLGLDKADDGREMLFLTMQFLEGETISARLKRGRMSLAEALPLIIDMAEGLSAAHNSGVIHRDFKSGNVMLVAGPNRTKAVITDFGLARASHQSPDRTALTSKGAVAGTVGYMSPEQINGEVLTPAADIYSLGIVAYEMVTGRPPFVGDSALAVAMHHLNDPPPSPRTFDPHIDAKWEAAILGCLGKTPAERFSSAMAFKEALLSGSTPRPPVRKWTLSRRAAIGTGVAGVATLIGGRVSWPAIDSVLHPLPQKRFVALMVWPEAPPAALLPVLNSVLDAIANRLARAESTVKSLLVIRATDVPGQTPKEPRQAVYVLGANLVLAASLHVVEEKLQLGLRILDAAAQRKLRDKTILVAMAQASQLPQSAATAAADLLQLPVAQTNRSDARLSEVAATAYQAYASAEELMRQPNYSKLDEAIASYQQALEIEPRFAVAYARIARAYIRKFQLQKEPASLVLAGKNADQAVQLAPDDAQSVFSRGLVDLYIGKTQEAMDAMVRAQGLDPTNTEIIMSQAIAFRDLDRGKDAETQYRRALAQRPNYWPAYNDLGWVLYRQGRLNDSLEAFREAIVVAPAVALPLTNAGSICMMLHRRDEAKELFERSLQANPNELATLNLGNIAFEDKQYQKALDYYVKARDLNPRSHQTFRDIGDCYDVMGKRSQMQESYARAADLLAEEIKANPRLGIRWMRMAFYDAKAGRRDRVEPDIRAAEERGASDVPAQFMKAQALAVIGRKEDAVQLVLSCLDRGLSQVEVELAPDLKAVRSDSRYRKRAASAAKTK